MLHDLLLNKPGLLVASLPHCILLASCWLLAELLCLICSLWHCHQPLLRIILGRSPVSIGLPYRGYWDHSSMHYTSRVLSMKTPRRNWFLISVTGIKVLLIHAVNINCRQCERCWGILINEIQSGREDRHQITNYPINCYSFNKCDQGKIVCGGCLGVSMRGSRESAKSYLRKYFSWATIVRFSVSHIDPSHFGCWEVKVKFVTHL